jgi:hypothetical protein
MEEVPIRPPLDSELVAAGHDGQRQGHYDGIVAFSQTDFTDDPK